VIMGPAPPAFFPRTGGPGGHPGRHRAHPFNPSVAAGSPEYSERMDASATFGPGILTVTGVEVEVVGVRVVIDSDFAEDEIETMVGRLRECIPLVHPVLLATCREIIIPRCRIPLPVAAAASAARNAEQLGQICIWWNGYFGDTLILPQIKVKTIEHECAHLMHPDQGPPNNHEWTEAIELDAAAHPGIPRLVDPVDLEDPTRQLLEDWAYSVQYLREDDRNGSRQFRLLRPNRAAIIDRVLA
jgi:hypothetical protein